MFFVNGMIKNLVFDMGGVLIRFDPDAVLTEHGITDPGDREIFKKEVFRSAEWSDYDRGTVTKDAFLDCIARLPEKYRPLAHRMLIERVFAANDMPHVEGMYELISYFKSKGLRIYLLSNAGQDFYVYGKTIPAISLFDGLFISSDWHLLKPEPEIYDKFFELFSLDPSECLFVDDLPANIEGAKARGMDGICWCTSRQIVEELKSRIEERL